jgi:YesN/AraC family two-component response regulator
LDSLYREKGASLKVIENLTKRIKVDSMLNASNLYIYDGLAQKYDIPKLEAEKEDLIAAMERKERLSNYTYIILAFLIALTFFGFVFEFRKRKMYKRKFDEIIKASENKKEAFTHPETKHSQKINIAEDIVENVLSALKTFEEKHQYTSNKITLNSLAKKLNTNPNYLSKIVNHYKGCSFSNYINGMRIDFCIEQLKNNPTFIKYTIKAISAEIGFNNVQSFSKAFYNSKGVYPSFFIKEMKKSKQKNATNS